MDYSANPKQSAMITIPKKIHLVYLSKEENRPEIFIECIKRMEKMHPAWEIITYDEDDAQKVLQDNLPELKNVYDNYHHIVQKADFLRIILVYLFGGFYMDMDIYLLKPLDELVGFQAIIAEEKTISDEECKSLNLKEKVRVANYMFGSVPTYGFWLDVISELIKRATYPINVDNDILESTGPGLLSDVYGKNKSSYKDLTLLLNNDRRCLNPRHEVIGCYFGNYAAHLHQGTWRRKIDTQSIKVSKLPLKFPKKSAHDLIKRIALENLVNGYPLKISSHRSANRDLRFLYRCISSLRNITIAKKIHLVIDDPLKISTNLHESDINGFFLGSPLDHIPPHWIEYINQHYSFCITINQTIQKLLTASGIKVPAYQLYPGFIRPKRNFEGQESPFFTVGFISNTKNKNYQKLILEACEELAQKKIPNIRLLIDTTERRQPQKNNDYVEYRSSIDSLQKFTEWYNDIHCTVFLNNYEFTFAPQASLYLGIPILTDMVSLPIPLAGSGFYNLIDFDESGFDGNNAKAKKEKIKKALSSIFKLYHKHQRKALAGARWIEDKWTMDGFKRDILFLLDKHTV